MVADLLTRPDAGPRQPRQEVAIMVRSMPWKLALIAVGALASLASSAGPSFADDSEGIVRICDQVPGQAASGCPSCQPGRPCRSHYGSGHGYCGNGYCGSRMRRTGYVYQFLDWFNPRGMCTHSPDHGYAPPGKLHTPHPQQVAYLKGFPDSWTGQPGVAGQGGPRPVSVYMPTDTTQLGYYYQAAPRWQARQGMIPPLPIPSQWHREFCQEQCQTCQHCRGQAAGGCPHCQGQAQSHSGEQIIQEGTLESQPIQSAPQPVPQAAPQPEAIPAAPEPSPAVKRVPEGTLEKAENLNLQPIN